MASTAKHVLTDLSPIIKVYTDGTVERLLHSPHVPPSPEDPTTGVSSKDATISNPPHPTLLPRLPKLTHPTQTLPILLYFHGGGFCIGSAFSSTDHRYLNTVSAVTGSLVISVEYRLAPEHPLPAAYDDSWEALIWVCSEKDQWIANHGDLSRVFIAGDSAGGNIAHNVALRAGSEPLPGNVKLVGAIISNPYFMCSNPNRDEQDGNVGRFLLEGMWLLAYPCAPGGIDNPWNNPLVDGAPGLSGIGCSKMIVFVAEKDLLTAMAKEYAEKVKESGWGGEVEVVEVEGEDHCFHVFNVESEKAKDLIKLWANFMKN